MIGHGRRAQARQRETGQPFVQAPPAVATRHLVLIAVDHVDRRLLELCTRAVGEPAADVQAVCLADDVAACREAVVRWRRLHATSVPVEVVDAEQRSVAEAIRARVDAGLESGWDHVTVLVPHVMVGRLSSWLHNQTSNAITRSLRRVPHVDVVRIPVHPW